MVDEGCFLWYNKYDKKAETVNAVEETKRDFKGMDLVEESEELVPAPAEAMEEIANSQSDDENLE